MRGVFLCKYCKGLPHPSAYASTMNELLHPVKWHLYSWSLFPKDFDSAITFSKINVDCYSISKGIQLFYPSIAFCVNQNVLI